MTRKRVREEEGGSERELQIVLLSLCCHVIEMLLKILNGFVHISSSYKGNCGWVHR